LTDICAQTKLLFIKGLPQRLAKVKPWYAFLFIMNRTFFAVLWKDLVAVFLEK